MIFSGESEQETPAERTCQVIRSQGKADTMLIESAIAGGAKQISLICQSVGESWDCFTRQFEFVQAAGGLVVNNAGEILFIFRHGRWDLPKGKVEENEDLPAAAVREVEEECGISGFTLGEKLISTWHTYLQNGTPMLKGTEWYLMHFSGTQKPRPQLEEGITDTKWIGLSGLREVERNTYPSVLDVVNTYKRKVKAERT